LKEGSLSTDGKDNRSQTLPTILEILFLFWFMTTMLEHYIA